MVASPATARLSEDRLSFLLLVLSAALAHGPIGDGLEQLAAGRLVEAQETAEHLVRTGGAKKRALGAGLLARVWLAREEPIEAAQALAPVAKHDLVALDVAEVRSALSTASQAARAAMDRAGVEALCDAALLLGELPPTMRYDRGWSALIDGEITAAVEDLEVAFSTLDPEERPFVAALVSEVRRDGSPEVALSYATEGVQDPGVFETDLHLLRGLAAWEAGELEVARDELAWLHLQRPTAIHAVWLGQVEVARGELDDAIALFEQAIRMSPDTPEAWMGLSVALQATGDPQRLVEARGALRKAAQLAPYDPNILQGLILVLKSTGDEKQAEPLERRLQLLAAPREEPSK